MSVRLEREGAIARLLIDRPDKRNAFNQTMWQSIPALVAEAEADAGVRVIILQSSAEGIFCAGADIGELMTNRDNADWLAANQKAINAAQWALTRADKPTIAFIDGDCVGGGCGLALACDMRIATERARLGITPAKLGLVYPLHDTKLLVDLVGPAWAKRIMFTGSLLPADEALRIGLVDEIGATADDLGALIAANSMDSTRAIKGFIRRVLDGQNEDDADTLRIFADAFGGPDFREGADAFLNKRRPAFR